MTSGGRLSSIGAYAQPAPKLHVRHRRDARPGGEVYRRRGPLVRPIIPRPMGPNHHQRIRVPAYRARLALRSPSQTVHAAQERLENARRANHIGNQSGQSRDQANRIAGCLGQERDRRCRRTREACQSSTPGRSQGNGEPEAGQQATKPPSHADSDTFRGCATSRWKSLVRALHEIAFDQPDRRRR
jgi:hypothetical protein